LMMLKRSAMRLVTDMPIQSNPCARPRMKVIGSGSPSPKAQIRRLV